MRLFAALALGVFVVCAQAQELKYRVVIQGQEIGEAKLHQTVLPNRGLRSRFEMKISGPGGEMTMKVDETTGPDGTPIKGSMVQTGPGGEEKIVRAFTAKGVSVTSTKEGKTSTKIFPYPKKGSVKSVSSLWFIVTRPKVGAKDMSFSLSTADSKWEQSVDTYVGVKSIVSMGKTVKAHFITSQKSKLWLDDKGMPYRMEIDEGSVVITMERK